MKLILVVVVVVLFVSVSPMRFNVEKVILDESEQIKKTEKRKNQPETLGEYIKRKSHDIQKRGNGGVSCPLVCGPPPLTNSSLVCNTNWAEDFETKSGCVCVYEYKCCPPPGECPSPGNITNCRSGGRAGLFHGVIDKDCCGCDVIKCIECNEPDDYNNTCTESAMAGYPDTCWTYNARGKNNSETGCFEATCEWTPPPAPEDQICDTTCMRKVASQDQCGSAYTVCAEDRNSSVCKRDSLQACSSGLAFHVDCYERPQRIRDPDAGFFYKEVNGSKTCEVCMKWDFAKIPCAADVTDCHRFGKNMFDRSCWRKKIDRDECDCEFSKCVSKTEDSTNQKFLPGQVCPKGTVRGVGGLSICGQERDICLPCENIPEEGTSELETFKRNLDCPFYGSLILEPATTTSCKEYVCVVPRIPDDCQSNTILYDRTTRSFRCYR